MATWRTVSTFVLTSVYLRRRYRAKQTVCDESLFASQPVERSPTTRSLGKSSSPAVPFFLQKQKRRQQQIPEAR